jgi:MYXO-CTERM domain-containing protein
MRKTLAALGAFIALLTVPAARADVVPWTAVGSDTTIFNNNSPAHTSSVTFKGLTVFGSSVVGGAPSGFEIFDVSVSSTAQAVSPDSFTNVPFTLNLSLTDEKSLGKAGAISTGTAQFTGTVSASSVTASGLVPGPVVWTSSSEVKITLGSPDDWRTYTLDLGSFSLGGMGPGSDKIFATLSVAPTPTGPPPPKSLPEPAGLVLAGLAVPALLIARRRKDARLN